jgi:hygromycin-B 7''-O-kinase
VRDERSAALTPAAAGALLRELLPGHRVARIVPRTGGQLNSVYEVRLAEPAPAVIVKVYAEAWRWKQAKEAHVYRLLRHHGVGPVPELLLTDDASAHVHGRACTVMTLIAGQPLAVVSASLGPQELHRVYQQMGEILADLHRIDQEAFGYLTTEILDPKPSNTAYMNSQFAKKLREFADLGGDAALRAAIERYVSGRAGLFAACDRAVLCHNDFHEGNVLVVRDEQRGWRVTGFIDVENAIAADPLVDLAKTDSYSVRGDPAKLAGLLDGYGYHGDAFAERLALYRLYHGLELWDWLASLGQTSTLDSLARDMRHIAVGAASLSG